MQEIFSQIETHVTGDGLTANANSTIFRFCLCFATILEPRVELNAFAALCARPRTCETLVCASDRSVEVLSSEQRTWIVSLVHSSVYAKTK